MKQSLIGILCGFIFAIGLGISGMTQPYKVISFLDIFGNWDPSLAFVMAGAIATYAIAYRLIIRRNHPLIEEKFQIPTLKNIDRPLVVGALLFGVGWGIAGYCPGPAFTSLASLQLIPVSFVASMLVGMGIYRQFTN